MQALGFGAPHESVRALLKVAFLAHGEKRRRVFRPGPYLQALKLLGMPLWGPSGPNGFSESSDAWSSPEGMKTRLELASSMGQRMQGAADPLDVLRTAFGDTASMETRQAVERAESREQALALLFMAPESLASK